MPYSFRSSIFKQEITLKVAPRSLEELYSNDYKQKGWFKIRQWR